VTLRSFGSQLSVLALAITAGALAEAVAVAVRAPTPVKGGLAVMWTLGLWALPGMLLAVALAGLLAALWADEPVTLRARDALREAGGRDVIAVLLLAAALQLGGVYGLARASSSFRNLELSALLLALLVLMGTALLGGAGIAAWRFLRERRVANRPVPLFWPALLVLAAVVIALVVGARSGFAQLDARLLLAPGTFLLVFLAVDRSLLVRGPRPRWVAPGAAALVMVVVLARGGDAAGAFLAEHGAWSPRLIAVVRALSDFDGDGHSSWLGGADCAPLDAAIHPGAAEKPGDGVDNNCIGGDSGKASSPRRPSWGASAHGSPSNLNVVVVTIETLRHDHASFVRAARDTTPELRKLAHESLIFERMYSAAPLTRLAIATLFSSYAPSEIDWEPLRPEKRMRRIGRQTPWLPELLRARGYETFAVLTDFSAFTAQEDAGFERGFQRYDTSTKLSYRGGTMWGFPAAEQVDKALGYVERARQPFLLWLHLFEPHYSYEQPPGAPVFGSDEQARYDAEIWHADQQVGRLIAGLRQRGLWDKTVLFVSGDHGEAFGEHDDRWHGSNLFDPQLRPAALLRIPGMPGKRVDVSVTFSDIAPTLARVLGDRATFDQLRGRSLTPLLHRRSLPEGDNMFVAESFSVDDGHAYQAAVVAYPLKLIYVEAGRKFSLFDLAADPRELQPLDAERDPRAAPLMNELVAHLERNRPRSLAGGRDEP
jgi:arylsulfatase A-like enzyme